MNEQNKELLLKDLSARLSHGVFCVGTTYELDDDGERYIPVKVKDTLTEIHNYKLETASVRLGLIDSCKLETVKPYLRPMSSMTEEEKNKYLNTFKKSIIGTDEEDGRVWTVDSIDWLNAHHFDYRDLIGKGLAIEVTEENNPYKE